MKKLKLSELDLNDDEVLTREQLKKVLGGDGSGYGECVADCNCVNQLFPNCTLVVELTCTTTPCAAADDWAVNCNGVITTCEQACAAECPVEV